MPYDTEVRFRVINDFGEGALAGEEQAITTHPHPEGLPVPEVLVADPQLWDAQSDWIFMSITETSGGFGAIYSDWWVFILDRSGRVVWAMETPSDAASLHHPFTDTDDGSIVWAATRGTNETLQMLTPNGEQIQLWDCKEHLQSEGIPGDCCSNSISWSASDNTFLYSFYSLYTMFEITPSGEVVRGFVLDDDTKTLTEIWSFGIGDGLWGAYMGEAHRLPGGNTLHNTGSLARLRETTPAGEVAWDVAWSGASGGHWIGRSTPVADLYRLAP